MINSVEINDAGNYTCYVSNIAATRSIGVTLTVAGDILFIYLFIYLFKNSTQ